MIVNLSSEYSSKTRIRLELKYRGKGDMHGMLDTFLPFEMSKYNKISITHDLREQCSEIQNSHNNHELIRKQFRVFDRI